MLLERGADPNVRTKEVPPMRGEFLRVTGSLAWVDFTGQTPFLTAALAGDVTVMQLLLEARRRSEHPDVCGHDGADGGRWRELGVRSDL